MARPYYYFFNGGFMKRLYRAPGLKLIFTFDIATERNIGRSSGSSGFSSQSVNRSSFGLDFFEEGDSILVGVATGFGHIDRIGDIVAIVDSDVADEFNDHGTSVIAGTVPFGTDIVAGGEIGFYFSLSFRDGMEGVVLGAGDNGKHFTMYA